MRTLHLITICALLHAGAARAAPPSCSNCAVRLTEDYAWLIGSSDFSNAAGRADSAGTYRWVVNGTTRVAGAVAEDLYLGFENHLRGAAGEAPVRSNNTGFATGRWGSALQVATNGRLTYTRSGNLPLDEGTVELWIAPRLDGTDPAYTSVWQTFFHYRATNGEDAAIAQSDDSGVIYAGGSVSGEWQSAYSGSASMRSWKSGEWHHVVYTYSATGNFMRLYLDGRLTADSNEGHYWPPPASATNFSVGCDVWGTPARYWIDEFRISGRAAESAEVAARARRTDAPRPNEIWLSTEGLVSGDSVAFEFTPADGVETGTPCASATLVYSGIPLTNPVPQSTLLPPGTTNLALTVRSTTDTACRYSLNSLAAYDAMTPFDSTGATNFHQAMVFSLNPDPNVINHVFVRCAAQTDYVMRLDYRCLASVNPPFPRAGNLWGWWAFAGKSPTQNARISLWLGSDGMTSNQIRELRQINSNLLVLTSMNAVENGGLTEDYYLHDIHGNKVEVWPGSYRLNLTKAYVAEFQAHVAANTILDNGLMYDGCFFDNVMLSQSWQDHDIYGDPFDYDADENGVKDDPAWLDAAWKAGVLHELEVFRELMPWAVTCGHSMSLDEPSMTNWFNGLSIGFRTANVLEGEESYSDLWTDYAAWCALTRKPVATMVESSPRDQIAYGYDYDPLTKIPTSTLEFARTYYPDVRFGLAFTLMSDGYFAHEYGDTDHGNDWWYDELDFNLGYPLGPAEKLGVPGTNQTRNGSFEQAIAPSWSLWADNSSGYTATVTRVTGDAAAGAASARLDITSARGTDWRVDLTQSSNTLKKGVAYEVLFWAKSDRARRITIGASKGSPNWDGYGLWREVSLTTNWDEYTVAFTAVSNVNDSRLQFLAGETSGVVWLDDIRLRESGVEIYRREFDYGLVLLNATRSATNVDVGPDYVRLTGNQAPRIEYIVDDRDASFSVTGSWSVVTNDSGEWMASGPFYHDWAGSARRSAATGVVAQWTLDVPEDGTYTVAAWWAALPANAWSTNVTFEIVTGGVVAASASFNQRTNGDRWHAIGTLPIATGSVAFVRMRANDTNACVADALHVWSASRCNDGTTANVVRLQPMDGIVLRRAEGTYADRDHDGLPDFWETQYFNGPTNGTAAGDGDEDGHNNLQEWIAGTDPTKPSSRFQVSGSRLDSAGRVICWDSVSNRSYGLDVSANPVIGDGWSALTSGLPATPVVNSYTDAVHAGSSQVFYRVNVRR